MTTGEYGWQDFEKDESTDLIPGKYVLTITDPDGEEMAVIVHRTCEGRYPLDGPEAERKRANARLIVLALNIDSLTSEQEGNDRA